MERSGALVAWTSKENVERGPCAPQQKKVFVNVLKHRSG